MRIALAAATILAIPSALLAQQTDTARLADVVISASAEPLPPGRAPATVTVVDGEALRARGIASVADALREVPGLALVRSGSFGGITSLFVRGGERDYVKVLVDGVPVNDAGGDVDLAHLTTDDVARIEVVRGPVSVLHGSDAVSGVVNIITRRAAGTLRGEAGARSGSHGARELDAAVRGARGAAAFSLTGAHRRTDGILAFNNDYRSDVIGGSARLAGAEGTVTLAVRRTNALYHFPTDGSGAVVDSAQYTRDARTTGALDVSRALGARATLELSLTSSDLDRTSANEPDSPGDTSGFYFRSDTRAHRRGGDLRARIALAPLARLTIGAAYEHQRERAEGTSRFGSFVGDPTRFDEVRDNRAAYAELVMDPHPRVQVVGGVRLDDNARFGTFTTGRLAGAVRIAATTSVRAAVGNAFKEPAFSEVFSTAFSVGDPGLQPERTRSWEVGFEHAVDSRARVGMRWFDQRFRDMIQYRWIDRAQDPTTPNYANIAAATARGLEVEAVVAVSPTVDVTTAITRLTTEVTEAGFGAFGTFEEGRPLLRRPERSASARLDWRPGARVHVSAGAQYVSERGDYDFAAGERVTLEPYTLVDASARVALPLAAGLPEVALTLRADNLFDDSYEAIAGFAAPGRTILAGVHVALGR